MYCIVCGAGKGRDNSDWMFTKHDFPKCPELRAKWFSLLNLKGVKIKARSRVCARHFSKDQYVRDRLKRTAVPMKVERSTVEFKSPGGDSNKSSKSSKLRKSSSVSTKSGSSCKYLAPKEQDLNGSVDPWKDKINLAGHCAFCLEVLTSANSERQTLSNISLESVSNLWSYLFKNETSGDNAAVYNFHFLRGKNKDGEPIFSNIPPMCSSCQKDIKALHDLHKTLEEMRKKLSEQTSLVNNAAMKIRNKSIDVSSKSRSKFVNSVLSFSNTSQSCISSTTKFLDCLSNPTLTPNSITIISNPIAIIPTINTAASQNPPNVLVFDAIGGQSGQAFCPQEKPTTTTIVQTGKLIKQENAINNMSTEGTIQVNSEGDTNKEEDFNKTNKYYTNCAHVETETDKLSMISLGHQKKQSQQHLQKQSYPIQSKRSRLANGIVLNKGLAVSKSNAESEYVSEDEELIDVLPGPIFSQDEFKQAEEDDYEYDNDEHDPLA